jgi:hypothetical protein
MEKIKRLIISILAGLQIPIAYYLSGHDLFVRTKDLGWIYLFSIYFTIFFYIFFSFSYFQGKK